MSFFVVIGIAFVIGIVVVIIQSSITSGNQQSMRTEIACLTDFTSTQDYMGSDGKSGIAIDETRQKVCFIRNFGDFQSKKIVGYDEILSSEVIEDDVSVTKTNRGSQIGGAVIGTVLAGGVGTLVGGLSGSKTTTGKVRKISLAVTVCDTSEPIHTIVFLDLPGGVDRGGINEKYSMENANRWHGILSAAMKQGQISQPINSGVTVSSGSIADELKKLADLYAAGVLSEQEFAAQKSKLLA